MNDKKAVPGKHTLIEEGTEFKGSLSSSCPIVVVGKIEGDVTGPMIHVASSGVVAGKVKVKQLRSDGELAGEVEAETVKIAGTVRDKTRIRAKSLEVTLHTSKGMEVVFGECELAIGDEPDKQAAITAAMTPPAPVRSAKPPEANVSGSNNADTMFGEEATKSGEEAKPGDDSKPRRHNNTQPPPL
jgi:cytoskeletal protein CcmA (bactofilin family)